MSGKLIITRGLSGSGKTTWAKDYCSSEPGHRVRVNRDDLRGMLFGGYVHGHAFEQMVTTLQQESIRRLLRMDRTVVVDDTNLALQHAKRVSKLAYEEGAEFSVIDNFLHVSLEECIRRDAERDPVKRVGEKVIRNQHARFFPMILTSPVPPYEPPAGLELEPYVAPDHKPEAIIVDLDGTLADMGDREPYDWANVGQDKLKEEIAEIVQRYAGYARDRGGIFHLVFMSGRDEVCRAETLKWLQDVAEVIFDAAEFDKVDEQGYRRSDHNVHLFMRPEGDNRKDSVVKLELFNRHVRHNFDVHFVLDDRDQVVEMWRKLGLTCLQVAPGAF